MIKISNLILSVIFIFLIIPVSFSQVTLEWVKYNSGPSGSSTYNQIIKTDPAGNSYISGSYIDGNQFKGFSFKYNTSGAAGTTYWTANQMQPTCFWIDNNFNTYSGGFYYQGSNKYLDVYKCSPQGIIWEVKDSLYGYGGNEAIDITSDDEGNTYLLRFEGMYSIYKYSPNGTCTKHPLSGIPEAARIAVDRLTNDLYLASYRFDFGKEGRLAKYDIDFNKQWETAFGVEGDVIKLLIAPSGNIYTLDNASGFTKFSSSGIYLIHVPYNGTPSDIVLDNEENIIITGNLITQKNNTTNYYSLVWRDSTPAVKLCVDKRNDIYLLSYANSDIITSKKNSATGYTLWTHNFNGSGNSNDSGYSISADTLLNIYVCGITNRQTGIDGIVYKLHQTLNSISGTIRDQNNTPVNGGIVKAFIFDKVSKNLVTTDTAVIQSNGTYSLSYCPPDSMYLITYKKNEFIPTYYGATIDWRNANIIYPLSNLSNVDIKTHLIENVRDTFRIIGTVQCHIGNAYTYLSDAIVYAEKDNKYKAFCLITTVPIYRLDYLQPGQYTLTACRIGFQPLTKIVNIGDTISKRVDFLLESVLSVSNDPVIIPKIFKLNQNYPNPFNPSTKISFDIPASSDVKITVYDFWGREIETIVRQHFSAGSYEVNWNASNYSSGVYFYKLTAGDYTESKKMILLK